MKVPIVLLVAGAVTILAFQNCSQSGFQFVDQNAKLSASGQGPLVEDVVQLIEEEEQQQVAEEEVKQEDSTVAEQPKEETQEVVEEVKQEVAEEVKQEEQQASEEVKQEEKQEVAEEKKEDVIIDTVVSKDEEKKNDEPKAPVMSDELFDIYACGNGKGKGQEKKALVCHHPAGDVEKAHELCISKNALKAHLEVHSHHGGQQDYLGPCVSEGQE